MPTPTTPEDPIHKLLLDRDPITGERLALVALAARAFIMRITSARGKLL